ncbi:MAG: alpha/beta hydrolase [Phycisphaeraceae bacterium]|nr:alpha/beta hydrolase [Phycisphaeraceae bacterium]
MSSPDRPIIADLRPAPDPPVVRARPRRLRRLLRVALVVFVAWCVMTITLQEFVIYPGTWTRRVPVSAPAGAQVLATDVAGPDRPVVAWLFHPPARGADGPSAPVPLVVYFHGNAELIGDHLDLAQSLTARGFAVLLPEYRGYGGCGGSPGQRELREDAQAFIDLAVAGGGVDPDRIVYIGRSLGGGIAADLAAARPPAALVLEQTFASVRAMALRALAPPFLIRHPYETDRTLPAYEGPVLLVCGSEDHIVPPGHMHRLRELRPDALWLEVPITHFDLPRRTHPEAYWKMFDALTEGIVAPKHQG